MVACVPRKGQREGLEQPFLRLAERRAQLRLSDTLDLQLLMAGHVPPNDANRALRHTELARNKRAHRRIRSATLGSHRDLQRQFTTSPARDLIATRFGGDVNGYPRQGAA